MSDYEMMVDPEIPVRTNYDQSGKLYKGLDPGIRFAVRVLHAAGMETCQSCQGGDGHAYDHPTVDLIAGGDAAGFMAVAVLVGFGLPVRDLSQVWNLDALGRPFETIWRVTFTESMEKRADDPIMFLRCYQAQRMPWDE